MATGHLTKNDVDGPREEAKTHRATPTDENFTPRIGEKFKFINPEAADENDLEDEQSGGHFMR
jgi:hypothetical protein